MPRAVKAEPAPPNGVARPSEERRRAPLKRRVRFLLATVAAGSTLALAAALAFAAYRIGPGATPHLVLTGGAGGFAVLGLIAWAWLRLDEEVLRPVQSQIRRLEAVAQAETSARSDAKPSPAVQELAAAVDQAAAALLEARQEAESIAGHASEAAEREKKRLETVLNDLRQGVIICTHEHRIMFFNRRAIEILHASGDIGLGRSLFSLISKGPVLHALDRLRTTAKSAGSPAGASSSPIVCSTADGTSTVQGRVSLLASERGLPGYVAIFDDVTRSLQAQLRRDHLLARAIEDLRRPAAGLRAAAELLSDSRPAPEQRQSLQALLEAETAALSDMLEQIAAEHEALVGGRALLEDISSDVLFKCVGERLGDHPELRLDIVGAAQALHCDSFTIVELLRSLAARLADEEGVRLLDLRATPGSAAIYVDLGWPGEILPLGRLDSWLGLPLGHDGDAMTGRDALAHHQTELWADRASDGSARLRLPLAPARAPVRAEVPIAERPEFYDFDLLGLEVAGPLSDWPLSDLNFVVFDTETTGLHPSDNDEIVSIAAKRIVKGRIMQGEIFDRLVNPGRPIPPSASRIHGITDQMVANAPTIDQVLPRFRQYIADAVLVAHNAAFDLKFLKLKEARCGVSFDMPVLDTVLLSAHLHDHSGQHTLDDLAQRLDVTIPPELRHSALGDATATAEVFLKMLKLLAARGVTTLGDALAVSNQAASIRRQQARY